MSHVAAGKRYACIVPWVSSMFPSIPGSRVPKAAHRIRSSLSFSRASRRAWLLAALTVPLAAQAQPSPMLRAVQATPIVQALDPVIVTATREPQALSRSSADVVVIDRAAVEASAADSVEDLLRRAAGVQIVRSGGPGQPAGYFVRGSSTNATVVLVDGIRLGSATLGQVDFESLSLAQIERVEILRGPASGLYGADAVGGVIQIFTRRGDGPLRTSAHAEVGGLRSAAVDAGLSGRAGAFDYAIVAGHDRSRGISAVKPDDRYGLYNPDDDGYRRTFGNAQLGWTVAPGQRIGVLLMKTRLESHYDGADYLPPTYAPDPSADFRTTLDTTVAALDYRGELGRALTLSARLARQEDDSTSGGASTSRFDTTREQAGVQAAWRYAAGQQLLLAWDHLRERVGGDVLVDTPKRRNDGIALGWSGAFGAHAIDASVRRDDNSAYGDNTTGRIGWAWRPIASLKLRASAGTSFRAPTFNDLYYPFYGVATVQPERGRSVELGAEWRIGTGHIGLTLWQNRVRDLIGYDPDSTGTTCPAGYFGCAGNVARARLKGATLQVAQQLGSFAIAANVDLLDARDADTGERLARRAAHQSSLTVDWAEGPWSAGSSLLVVGSRPDGGAVLGSYALVDLRAGWRFAPAWRLEARLTNALDRRYEPLLDYNGVGRRAWIGIRHDSKGL